MNSAEIIKALGGAKTVAQLCEVTEQAVSQWCGLDPKTKRQREIPRARLMYLKAIRPGVFRGIESAKPRRKPEPAQAGA